MSWYTWPYPGGHDPHQPIAAPVPDIWHPPLVYQPPVPFAQPWESEGQTPVVPAVAVVTPETVVVEQVVSLTDANLFGEHTGEGIHVVVDASPGAWAPNEIHRGREVPDANLTGAFEDRLVFVSPTVDAPVDSWFVVPPEYQPAPYDTNLFSEHTGGTLPDIAKVVADLDSWFQEPTNPVLPAEQPNVGPTAPHPEGLVTTITIVDAEICVFAETDTETLEFLQTDAVVAKFTRTDPATAKIR